MTLLAIMREIKMGVKKGANRFILQKYAREEEDSGKGERWDRVMNNREGMKKKKLQ